MCVQSVVSGSQSQQDDLDRRNGLRYQRVLALFFCFVFLTGAIPKGLVLRKFCFWGWCMHVLHKLIVSGLILQILANVWFDDFCAEKLGNRLKFVFSPDIILCDWLGSKYKLTLFFIPSHLSSFLSSFLLLFPFIVLFYACGRQLYVFSPFPFDWQLTENNLSLWVTISILSAVPVFRLPYLLSFYFIFFPRDHSNEIIQILYAGNPV